MIQCNFFTTFTRYEKANAPKYLDEYKRLNP